MNRISTGRQPLPLMVVASILSLSLVVNLPGLAVTPMLAQLKVIFPDSTQFEEQLLSLMPNLVIVPFLIISGRLSATRHKIGVVVAALLLFTASSVAYFFIQSMCGLIIVSVFLGAGAGLLIPFSTGLLSDAFSGQALTQQMGLQSGISNLYACRCHVCGRLACIRRLASAVCGVSCGSCAFGNGSVVEADTEK